MIAKETPIHDVIAAHPETRAVFAKHGLDACCGGAHPIEMPRVPTSSTSRP